MPWLCRLRCLQVRNVPVYFSWVSRISYFSFATDILTANEFDGLQFYDPSTSSSVPGEALVPDVMKTGLSMAGNVLVLGGITLGCRLLCWALLELAAWRQVL